eukprot:2509880-Rhodomonas_salina.1
MTAPEFAVPTCMRGTEPEAQCQQTNADVGLEAAPGRCSRRNVCTRRYAPLRAVSTVLGFFEFCICTHALLPAALDAAPDAPLGVRFLFVWAASGPQPVGVCRRLPRVGRGFGADAPDRRV